MLSIKRQHQRDVDPDKHGRRLLLYRPQTAHNRQIDAGWLLGLDGDEDDDELLYETIRRRLISQTFHCSLL